MRILHVIHGYYDESEGGAEAYTRELMAEQRRQGHSVTLLTGSMVPWDACGIEEIEHEDVRVLRLHRDDYYFDIHAKAYHPGVERLVRDVLRVEKPDVIHLHQWIRLTSNMVQIADELDIPTVITLHDLYTSCPRAFRVDRDEKVCDRPLSAESCADCVPRFGHESDAEIAEGIELHHLQYQSELARARAVHVGAAVTGDVICDTTGFPPGKFTALPLSYRRRFADAPVQRTPLPTGDEPFRFAYWGNITQRKGAQTLLEALARVRARGPDRAVEVHLFGSIDTTELRDVLHRLAEGNPVVFHGRYEYADLADAHLHMAVFPIHCFETFGFVLDEATELGLPSIVTDLGALPQRAGASALTVPSGDAEALAAALEKVLDDPSLRDRLAEHLPALPPTLDEHATEMQSIYERARTAAPIGEAPPVDPLRRAAFLVTQRESAERRAKPGAVPR